MLSSGLFLCRAQHNSYRGLTHPFTHSNVSAQCQSTLIAVAASPQSDCLNPSGLLQVFLKGTTGSVVTPVDTWLKGLCARGPCSNENIALIVTNVTSGCATDLGLGNSTPGSLTPLVQQIYPTVRKAVCLAEYVFAACRMAGCLTGFAVLRTATNFASPRLSPNLTPIAAR